MFKHPKCGGQHETVSQARQCETGGPKAAPVQQYDGQIESVNYAEEAWPWTEQRVERQEYSPSAKRPFTLGYAYAEALADRSPAARADLENGPEFIAPAPIAVENPERHHSFEVAATVKQLDFLKILLAERDWETGLDNDPIALKVADGGMCARTEAGDLITALKALPKRRIEPAAHPEQPWRKLSREVPAGNYKITDAEGKNHFYRISVGKNGYYKLQERASEELHFVSLNRYAGILQAILNTGVESARLAYSTDQTRCWHCNLKLTDNTQPHYARGLGPKCGEEH
jgi:hypothetical protein